MIQLRKRGAHAVIPQTACMVGRRNETAAQRVHLCQRANFTGIAEIIRKLSACQARTGSRFNCQNAVIRFSAQLFAHKRCNQATQIGTAAGTANDQVRLYAQLIECNLGLQTNNRLMQYNLRQNRTQYIPISFMGGGIFYGF